MTDKPTPTDAEILELASQYWYSLDETESETEIELVRAALAKWGQPAQAAEPVAWLRNTTDPQPHAVTNLNYRSAVDAKAGVEYLPVFAAPQPVAREPLSHAQAKALVLKYGNDPLNLVFQVELAHGIKGGQHGDAKP